MKNSNLPYSVGALLYCPANNHSIADSIIQNKFGTKFSLALCLEDTIQDDHVLEAEETLYQSLLRIDRAAQQRTFYLPKIFIRVRCPQQMLRLSRKLGGLMEQITGFILPKFSLENVDSYIETLCSLNSRLSHPLYMMPIYESASLIDLRSRYDILYQLKDALDEIESLVLNIRVGGNDLCHIFGLRRHADESIHKIAPISHIFSDLITVYGLDYVISGPVYEYFNGENWKEGFKNEISDDQLCGFIGKTIIHPNQISVMNQACAVSASDFASANSILNWDKTNPSLVSSDFQKTRMDEYKTHTHWAKKILYLAKWYGVREK